MKHSSLGSISILVILLFSATGAFVAAQDNSGQTFLPVVAGHDEQLPATATPAPDATPAPVGTPATPVVSPTPTRPSTPGCEQYGQGITRSSHFGAQMYWDTRPENQFFAALAESNVGWVRVEVTWYRAEPENTTPENYDWSQTDEEMAVAMHTNINVLGTFVHAPLWAAGSPDGPFRPGMQDEFVEFVSAVVERYDGDGVDDAPCAPVINYWELYNEPDDRHDWGYAPDQYAAMLEAVYPEVKAANPNAQVVFGGVAQDRFEDQDGVFVRNWVQDVLAAGGGPYFDVMNIHNYPGYWPEWDVHFPGTVGKVATFNQILADAGFTKPMMITETGDAIIESDGWLPHRQAMTLVEVMTSARAANVDTVIWFTFHDLPDWSIYHGLVTHEVPPQLKPSYFAFRTLAGFLETADYVRTWTPERDGGASYVAYEFDDATQDRRLLVAWTFRDITPEVRTELAIPASQASRFDVYGTETMLTDDSDGQVDGRIKIAVGSEPVIVTWPR